jgi:branched-chain amino acid transport system ATP-binding protein
LADLLTVDRVSKSFGSLAAVNDVSFAVREGEIYGIAGPNGAGKTTLFNLVTGWPFAADSGSITFESRRIEALAPHVICRLGIARTFQQETAFDTLTVAENVRVAAVYGGGRGDPLAATTRVLKLLDLDGLQDQEAAKLPLYTKKRLMFASALATDPRLLMLDEPAAGLNHIELDQLHALILRVRETGISVVIIEHVLPLLFGVSDRVLIMESGRALVEGTPSAVARDDRVIEAYLGERGRQAAHADG